MFIKLTNAATDTKILVGTIIFTIVIIIVNCSNLKFAKADAFLLFKVHNEQTTLSRETLPDCMQVQCNEEYHHQ